MLKRIRTTALFRINDRDGIGKIFVGFVVVEDDHVDALRVDQVNFLVSRNAAVDGNHKRGPLCFCKLAHFFVHAVAVDHSVRNMVNNRNTHLRQNIIQQHRGGHPIDIIVADDKNALFRFSGLANTRDRLAHVF